MEFVRMSVRVSTKESLTAADTSAPIKQEEINAEAIHLSCLKKCSNVLPLILDAEFRSKYWTLPPGLPDCYVFSRGSSRCTLIEAVTRFHPAQLENFHSYKFTAHKLFEDKLKIYTRAKGNEKPNPNHVRSRTWDVALNVVIKIEALRRPFDRFRYLLKREYKILEYMWSKYLDSSLDIDEMTGIPMVFERVEVPNDVFYAVPEGYPMTEIDNRGKMKPLRFEKGTDMRSTLAYMTMEKLGPNIGYLLQLVRATQRPPLSFDLWTAMKIFDQLLCRILQLHKLRVVHNDICPDNIYMGNGVAFDVVYLNNYKRSYYVAEDDKDGPTELAVSCVGCDIRFASVGQLSGSSLLMSPIDDIESAFYLLVAMLNSNSLPWDSVLKVGRMSEADENIFGSSNSTQSTLVDLNSHNPSDEELIPFSHSRETVRKILEIKQRFWQSNHILNLLLSNAVCAFPMDDFQATGIATAIREVYYRVKDWRHNFKGVEESSHYCKKLARVTSEEYRNFVELRKCALVYFEFAERFDFLNEVSFRNKLENLKKKEAIEQHPWNYLAWCFNNIEIKIDSKTKMHSSGALNKSFYSEPE